MRVLIIGGSDAGISAALRIREPDRSVPVQVALADDYPNWSICGLPYYLGGETPDWRTLAHRTEFEGIELLRGHRIASIDVAGRLASAVKADGATLPLPYDRLVLATGAAPVRPDLPGMELPGVHLLHTMGDALGLGKTLESQPHPRSAVVVGAGYIGLEMAEALVHRGLRVTLVSRTDPVFPTVDPVFGQAIEAEMHRNGVRIRAGCAVATIERTAGTLAVCGQNDLREEGDLVLVAVGTRPETHLAREAGLKLGARDAIVTDRAMRTGVPDVFAAGDCVETWHRVLERNVWLPLGTTAHKQGRVAGETVLGGGRLFPGCVGTQVLKLFDIVAARTGLLEAEARKAGFEPLTVETAAWDHKAYYPGARQLRIRVTGDRRGGRLLGAQILGPWQSEIAKRIDIFATALFHGMTVDAVSDLDLSYAPPFASPWDPVQIATQAWSAAKREACA